MGKKLTLEQVAKKIAVCDSKAVYKRKGEAMKMADRNPLDLVPYRCDICGEWHLTKNRNR